MDFEFRRKYDGVFLFGVLMLIVAVSGTIFVNNGTIKVTPSFLNYVYVLIWFNFLLLNLAYLTITHRKYFINFKGLVISKPLVGNIIIDFQKITNVTIDNNDKVFLFFGNLPSITFSYLHGKRVKTMTIRTHKNALLYKFLKNEKDIKITLLKDQKNK